MANNFACALGSPTSKLPNDICLLQRISAMEKGQCPTVANWEGGNVRSRKATPTTVTTPGQVFALVVTWRNLIRCQFGYWWCILSIIPCFKFVSLFFFFRFSSSCFEYKFNRMHSTKRTRCAIYVGDFEDITSRQRRPAGEKSSSKPAIGGMDWHWYRRRKNYVARNR